MDFLKISIWLLTTVLAVNSYSRSHMGLNCRSCPYYPFNYAKLIQDQSNCFCFDNQKDYKKVPEVINHGGLFSERLVYYVYKDILTGRITLYIPNRDKQILIPDLAYEEKDIIFDNPSDFIHSFNDLKVIIEIHQNNFVTHEPIVIDNTVTTVTTDKPTITTEALTTITDGKTVTTYKPTAMTEEPTVTTKKSTFPTEEPTISTEKHTVTTEEPTGTTEGATIITDEPPVTNKKPTVTTENPTDTTNEPTVTIEEKTVTNVIRSTTTDEPSTTEKLVTINNESSVTTEIPTVITENPTDTTVPTFITEKPTTITDEPSVITEIPTVITEKLTDTTVSTLITEEPTTAEVTIISETTIFPTKVPSTEEPITTATPEKITFTTKEPTTEELWTTTPPEPTITTAEPTTSEQPSPFTISPLPDDDSKKGKVFSLQDLYVIIQFIQKKKGAPDVDLWEQILKELELDESQINIHRDYNKDTGGQIEFDIRDESDFEHDSYTFDIWFQQQLDGFSESDQFITLVEIKQYVRNILLENGMIVTTDGLVTDLEGALLDLRGLKLRPILIGKPLNINKIFEQKDQKSDFLIPSDSPYMQALVVTLSNPSMILGIIPLGKTIIKKSVQKSATVQPQEKYEGIVKEWVQNGNKYGKQSNRWKENFWFNIKGRPKLSKELKDLYLIPPDKKIIEHKYFEEPENGEAVITFKSPTGRSKVKSSKLLEVFGENDLRKLDALKNLLFNDQKKFATKKDSLTAWQNNGNVQKGEIQPLNLNVDPNELEAWENMLKDTTRQEKNLLTAWQNNGNVQKGEIQPLNLNVDPNELEAWENMLKDTTRQEKDLLTAWQNNGNVQKGEIQPLNLNVDPNELEAWENMLKDTTRQEKDLLTAWKNTANSQTDGELISSLNDDDSMKLDILNNRLILDSKLIPANGLLTSWEDVSHLQPGNVKLDSIDLDALNHKFVNGPISSEANDMHSFGFGWKNREKGNAGSGQVISFKADNPSELDALKKQLLDNPNLYGKAGMKLLAALQGNKIVKEGTGETITYKVDNLNKLDKLRMLLKDPTIFAKTAKNLLSALQRKGIVQAGNGEAVKFKVHNPRELEALRNQLLTHPKIFSRAAKEILTVMEHNGIGLSDIAPVTNETAATFLEDSVPSVEKYVYTQEYLPPQEVPWPSEDAVGYYDEVEDDITGRIVGGSAATGSGAPLSMKGRMKDF